MAALSRHQQRRLRFGACQLNRRKGTASRPLWFEPLELRRMLDAVPQLVRDLNATTLSSSIGPIVSIGDTAFFSADDGIHGAELWKSDGTADGTMLVKDITPGSVASNPSNLTVMNGTLYFQARGSLWQSDGTTAGTVQVVTNLSLGNNGTSKYAILNGEMYFSASDGTLGQELWKSNGTAAGTVLVKDIQSGSGSSSPGNLTVVNGSVYFTATTTTTGAELWKTDGTSGDSAR